MAATILEQVKTARRIRHNELDSEIEDNIAEARAEMVRSGIDPAAAADDTKPLVVSAIKAYCKMVGASDKAQQEGYEKSWLYQLDCLRKSDGYMKGTVPEPNGGGADV